MYQAIEKKARELQKTHNLLQAFETDLTKHDYNALQDYTGQYIWAIGTSCTHILTQEWYVKNSCRIKDRIAYVSLYTANDQLDKVFFWNGKTLQDITGIDGELRSILDSWN